MKSQNRWFLDSSLNQYFTWNIEIVHNKRELKSSFFHEIPSYKLKNLKFEKLLYCWIILRRQMCEKAKNWDPLDNNEAPFTSVLPRLQCANYQFIRRQDVHVGAPTGKTVSVERWEQAVRNAFIELLWVHVWFVEGFAGAVKELAAGTADLEVAVVTLASNTVVGAHDWLPTITVLVKSCDHWCNKVWAPPKEQSQSISP